MVLRQKEKQESKLFTINDSGLFSPGYNQVEATFESSPVIVPNNDDMSWLEGEQDDDVVAEQVITERDCSSNMKCWQYQIREKFDSGEAVEQLELLKDEVDIDITKSILKEIPRDVAKPFIEKYEWLGTLGTFKFGYGLFFPYKSGIGHKLGGVACFSKTTTWQAEVSICGEEYRDKVILLCRGACANWCSKGTNSHLISLALKSVERDTKYRIVLAYSDRRAGEVGTIYQATNWYFIGWGATGYDNVPKGLVDPNDVRFHTRGLPKELKSERRLKEAGYEVIKIPRANKGRYIYFLGSRKERKELLRALRFKILPYPKREDFSSNKKLKEFNARLAN